VVTARLWPTKLATMAIRLQATVALLIARALSLVSLAPPHRE